jgi:hypothetical protein
MLIIKRGSAENEVYSTSPQSAPPFIRMQSPN